MAIGAHNILSKTDRAIKAYLASVGVAADVLYTGKNSGDKGSPAIIVYSERASLPMAPSAVYDITVNVLVKTIPCVEPDQTQDQVKDTSEELVTQVFDALFCGLEDSGHRLGELVTAAARNVGGDLANYTATEIVPDGVEAGVDAKGNAWIDTLVLKVLACPRNVS